MSEFKIGDTVRIKSGSSRSTLFEVVGLPVPHERNAAGDITQKRDGRLHVRYKDDQSHICHVDQTLYEVVEPGVHNARTKTTP